MRRVDRRTNALPNRQTDRPTNRQTDTASYRGALAHLKRFCIVLVLKGNFLFPIMKVLVKINTNVKTKIMKKSTGGKANG